MRIFLIIQVSISNLSVTNSCEADQQAWGLGMAEWTHIGNHNLSDFVQKAIEVALGGLWTPPHATPDFCVEGPFPTERFPDLLNIMLCLSLVAYF